jgi:hypothetical protein
MANAQVVEAERQTMTGALVEPRSPLEVLGPLRGSSKFSSPLWQAPNRKNAPSDAETPIDDISGPTKGLSPAASPRMEGASDETESVDACLDAVACGWFDEGALTPGYVDQEAGLDVDHGAGSGVDFDAPTETFHGALLADARERGPSGMAGSTGGTADPERRSFPWPPSPWPRDATAPTVKIRLADLLSRADEDADLSSDEATDPNDESAGPAASPVPIKLSRSLNARTLVLAAIASLVVLGGGALFVGPMGAVTIAPEAGPTSAASGAPRVSGASVVPAVLARPPAPAYPASIERLDAPKTNPSAKPSGPAGNAAMSGIPGMMGTPVPSSTPGHVGTHSNDPAATALSTAARSSDSDGPLNPVEPRGDLARGDHSWGHDRGGPTDAFGGDSHFDDAAQPQGSGSGLVDGLVGGVLN